MWTSTIFRTSVHFPRIDQQQEEGGKEDVLKWKKGEEGRRLREGKTVNRGGHTVSKTSRGQKGSTGPPIGEDGARDGCQENSFKGTRLSIGAVRAIGGQRLVKKKPTPRRKGKSP